MNPPLTRTERLILTALEQRRGYVMSRQALGNLRGMTAQGRTLDVHIGRIRRKLGQEVIVTVSGEGYMAGPAHTCEACGGRGVVVGAAL